MNKKVKAPKPHPWRTFSPGWLKKDSDKVRADRIIPVHARMIRS